jgi:hypothetical protein
LEEDEDEDEDEEDEDEDFDEESTISDDSVSSITTTSSSNSSSFYIHEYFFGSHWPKSFRHQRPRLLALVRERLIATFTATPSLTLYRTLLHSLSEYSSSARRTQLLSILSTISTTSAYTLSAALYIYAYEDKAPPILSVLSTHSHLLRAQDHPALVLATQVLCTSALHPIREKGLEVLRRELEDSARAIRAAIRACFPKYPQRKHVADLGRALALPRGSPRRAEQIGRWIEDVMDPGPPVGAHPMALAALMLGVPIPHAQADTDEGEMYFLDADEDDEELVDAREEFRPKLRERWEAWVGCAGSVKGGKRVLEVVGKGIVGKEGVGGLGFGLGWMGEKDVVNEMIGK